MCVRRYMYRKNQVTPLHAQKDGRQIKNPVLKCLGAKARNGIEGKFVLFFSVFFFLVKRLKMRRRINLFLKIEL